MLVSASDICFLDMNYFYFLVLWWQLKMRKIFHQLKNYQTMTEECRWEGQKANLKSSVARKQNTPNFPKNNYFLVPDTHTVWDSPSCVVTDDVSKFGFFSGPFGPFSYKEVLFRIKNQYGDFRRVFRIQSNIYNLLTIFAKHSI